MECKLPDSKLYQKEVARIYRLIEGQAHCLRGLIHAWKNDSSMLLITKSESGEHCIRLNATQPSFLNKMSSSSPCPFFMDSNSSLSVHFEL